MIVFGSYYDESVTTLDGRRELWVFHLLASVIEFHRKLAHVDEPCLDLRTLLCLLKDKARSVFASPSLTSGPKNHRNKKWAFHFNTGFTGFVTSKESGNQLNPVLFDCRWPELLRTIVRRFRRHRSKFL